MQDQEFKLKPSRHYTILMATMLFVSIDIMALLPLTLWLKVPGIIFVALYGGFVFWQYSLLRTANSIISIRRQADGRWLLQTNRGKYQADLSADSTVTGLVSVLRFYEPKKFWRRTCVIFRDSLGREEYRRLLVTLKG